MSNRKELIEAMKVLKNHCKTVTVRECLDGKCEISEECRVYNFTEVSPENWRIKESETK